MRIVAVVVVAVCCMASCGSDPLDNCFEQVDGTLDCSYQDFTGVDLSGRDLRNVDLSNADLEQANLTGVNLDFANLTDANLAGANLAGATANENTIWSDGFDPEAAGVVFVEDPGMIFD